MRRYKENENKKQSKGQAGGSQRSQSGEKEVGGSDAEDGKRGSRTAKRKRGTIVFPVGYQKTE